MEEIFKRIPHRPPFLFVDEIEEFNDSGLVATKTWQPDAAFYQGHYPGNPITPGVLLCESVFQAGAVYLSHRMEGEAPEGFSGMTPVLSRIQEAKFKQIVQPGEQCRIEVTFREQISKFSFLTGKVFNGSGKLAVALEFALALVPDREEEGGRA